MQRLFNRSITRFVGYRNSPTINYNSHKERLEYFKLASLELQQSIENRSNHNL